MSETITATDTLCPICGEGMLVLHVEEDAVAYKGVTRTVPSQYKVCTACGSEQADMDDLRVNKRAMQAFKKEVDGLLTGQEVRRIRERLGLTQAEAAELFGGGPVAFSKYESDDVMQSEAMDKLLRLANSFQTIVLNFLRQRGGHTVPSTEKSWTPIVLEGGKQRISGELSREDFSAESQESWRDAQ